MNKSDFENSREGRTRTETSRLLMLLVCPSLATAPTALSLVVPRHIPLPNSTVMSLPSNALTQLPPQGAVKCYLREPPNPLLTEVTPPASFPRLGHSSPFPVSTKQQGDLRGQTQVLLHPPNLWAEQL